jgi:hypothetical protein
LEQRVDLALSKAKSQRIACCKEPKRFAIDGGCKIPPCGGFYQHLPVKQSKQIGYGLKNRTLFLFLTSAL